MHNVVALRPHELGCIRIWPLELDLDDRRLYVHAREVTLTRTQFEVLAALMERPHQVTTRITLMEAVWGDWREPSTIDAHVSRLRTKIIAAGGPRVAEPVRGVGYRLGIAPSVRPAA